MFITLQVTLPAAPVGGTFVKSLKDALNEARATKNVYPKIESFCKYLSLQLASGGGFFIAGSSDATMSDVGFFPGADGFVLQDMNKGLVPLGDIYLVNNQPAASVIRVVLIQDNS